MKLSTLAIGVGLLFSLPEIYALLKPAAFSVAARRFHRSENWGYVLMGLGTLWFLSNVQSETISDFAPYKRMMLVGFGLIGALTCVYVKDYLAVRGLAIVLLLLSKLLLDSARWHQSEWRLVISILCYIWIVTAMWLMVSPWRLRDFLQWLTSNERRLRLASGLALGVCLLVTFLGAAVF